MYQQIVKKSECKYYNRARRLERYYENKDKKSINKRYFLKNLDIKNNYRNKTLVVYNLET